MERYSHILSSLSALGIITSALAIMLLSALWYSSRMFGRAWMRHTSIRSTDITLLELRRGYFFGSIIALLQSFLIALIVSHAGAQWHIIIVGIGTIWVFILLELLHRCLWERAALALICIHAFRALACMLAAAFTYQLVSTL